MKIEYGLLIALIASTVVIGYTHITNSVAQPFETLSDEMAPETKVEPSSKKPCLCEE